MNKILIVLLLTMLTIPTFAGDNAAGKGTFVVSAPFISAEFKDGDLYSDASVNGQVGMSVFAGNYELGIQYFVINGLAVGGSFGMLSVEQSDNTSETITIEPMISYYLKLNSVLPYMGISYKYMILEAPYLIGTTTVQPTTTDTFANLKAGAAFMLGSSIAAYGEASYSLVNQSVKTITDDGVTTTETNSENTGTIITFALGFKAFF